MIPPNPHSMWCMVEDHAAEDDDGNAVDHVVWAVSLADGFNPRRERSLNFRTWEHARAVQALLQMGLGGLVGEA